MVFPVVTYCCESWTIKKAERQRIDAFELWTWTPPPGGGEGQAVLAAARGIMKSQTWLGDWTTTRCGLREWPQEDLLKVQIPGLCSILAESELWVGPRIHSFHKLLSVVLSIFLFLKILTHKPFEGSCGILFTFVSIVSKQHHTHSKYWIQSH